MACQVLFRSQYLLFFIDISNCCLHCTDDIYNWFDSISNNRQINNRLMFDIRRKNMTWYSMYSVNIPSDTPSMSISLSFADVNESILGAE